MEPNYRRCVSCRKIAPKTDFWRVVRTFPDQAVQVDGGMGRSAYLCPNATCLRDAERKDRLGRSLKVPISKTIYQTLWSRLTEVSTLSN
ncbi:YlxR family protein [Alkalinema sp. FACHB-956]|uniref:YlxR family protein n=1 Tax=Alkalinema sp. FACHB-956 TaxID=2692768 RepID=UPI001682B209|nr:YlxR family protein [Alkalinema sp. FACHB-956]MBD2328307.1 YlxR family protein [Alkalinema sp. FACHB-956]